MDNRLLSDRFPLSNKYHPEWLIAGCSGGANPLWLTEWLSSGLGLRPGMRVLDLGCGRALSSIFLRMEFDVEVWAVDLWFSASENLKRIRAAGVENHVYPIHAEARTLPFADDLRRQSSHSKATPRNRAALGLRSGGRDCASRRRGIAGNIPRLQARRSPRPEPVGRAGRS